MIRRTLQLIARVGSSRPDSSLARQIVSLTMASLLLFVSVLVPGAAIALLFLSLVGLGYFPAEVMPWIVKILVCWAAFQAIFVFCFGILVLLRERFVAPENDTS